jgi:hypothetical protein
MDKIDDTSSAATPLAQPAPPDTADAQSRLFRSRLLRAIAILSLVALIIFYAWLIFG